MNSIDKKNKNKLIFYICGVAFPVLQFVVFYLIINFNSFLMAFQEYDMLTGTSTLTLKNFPMVWNDIFFSELKLGYAFLNSFKYYIVSILFATGFNILFSNYIYKKFFGSRFFQIMLFLPKIISTAVLSVVFIRLAGDGYVKLMQSFGVTKAGLLSNTDTKFNYVMIFTIWSGFGTGVLMYTSTMTGISQEIVESAELDGITPFKELIFITLPLIYPTFVTFMIVNFAAIFTNEMSLYLFYGYDIGNDSKTMTIGYFLFAKARMAEKQGTLSDYNYLSAFGLLLSMIAIPCTFVFKWLLEKIGPSVE